MASTTTTARGAKKKRARVRQCIANTCLCSARAPRILTASSYKKQRKSLLGPSTKEMNKKSLPDEFTSLPTKCTLCPPFHSLPRPPHFFPRPPNSLPSLLRLQGLRQLRGSQAVVSSLFTIAVTRLPRKTQPMADIDRGRQSRTGGGTIYCTRPFQVPDTLTARGQHGPAARQSRV